MRSNRFSVRSRLVFSFGAIALSTILASAVGVLAFGNGWATIEDITRSHLPTLTTAHQLAQQSKAIAATAPILLFATAQSQRRTTSDRIADQMAWLEKLADRLRDGGIDSLGAIEREKDRLLESFRKLDELIEAKIGARIEKEEAIGELLATHRALRDALGAGIGDDQAGSEGPPGNLEILSAAAADSLWAAANAARPEHLKEIEKAFRQTVRHWERTLAAIRGGAGADVLELSEKMMRFGTRPDNIFRLREKELDAAARAERILYVYNQNASRLVFAADAVIELVYADIAAATRESRANLIFHGVFLILIAVVCVSGAVFLSGYISRNIGGRLAALQGSMEVHASGGTCEIPSGGNDEITLMSGALQTFIDTIDQREAQLRQSEASLANAQRIAEVGNWEWDFKTNQVHRSAEMCRLLGLTPGAMDASPDTLLERVHPDDKAAVERVLQATIEKGEPFTLSFRLVLPDGAVRVVQEQGEVTFGEAGEPVLVAGTTQDITERERAQEALRESEQALQARVADLEDAKHKLEMQGMDLVRLAEDLGASRDEAEAANRAKSQFLANMSHELRTPLNAIIGFAEVIQAEKLGPIGCPEYRDYVKEINDAGQHLLKLIMDILDMSKIEAGKADLHEEPVDVGEAIRSSVAMVSGRAQAGDVTLEQQNPAPLPPLHADERMLKQILVNLLTNAVKFTPAGGTVTIKARTHPKDGYVIHVSDTGMGMAGEEIPQAMTRFVQLESQHNRKHEGTGLGLPLSKALVELHGGTLDLQSEVGVGTTATVRLPAERILASLDHSDSLDGADRAAS